MAFRWTIKRKLLGLAGATLFPLLLLFGFWVSWEVREHTADAQASVTLASRQAATRIRTFLEGTTDHLRALARNPAVQRRQVGRMEELFRELRDEHPDFVNLFAVSSSGQTIATAVPEPAGAPVTDAELPWFRRVLATGEPGVSGFQVGHIVGQPVVVVAIPLREGDGPPAGLLAAALNLRRLHDLFQFLPLAPGMMVTAVDQEGQVLSHAPYAESWIGKRIEPAALLPAGMVTGRVRSDGEERIVGAAPVAGTDWRVVVAIPAAPLRDRA